MMTTDPQTASFPQQAPMSQGETVVIPPAEAASNPYAPQIPQQQGRQGGGGRGIVMIALVLAILVLLGIGGYFVYQMVLSGRVVTIQYYGLWEEESTMRTVIAAFQQKNPKIQVEYIKQNIRQYRERVSRQIDNGEGPDVFQFHNTWVPMLANQLSLVPADVMTPSEFASTFYPVASQNLVADNLIYGLPSSIDGLGMYYNEDILAQKGVSPPVSWTDFLTIVPLLTERGEGDIINRSAIALGTTNNIEHFSDILAVMLRQNQANLTRPEGAPAEETFLYYRNFADPTSTYYTWNEMMDNSVYAFATEKVAMIFAPSWRAFEIKQINPNLKFKIAPIPQLPSGNIVTWSSYWVEGVSAKTRYPKQSWEFVKFLTSSEGQTLLYTEASKTRLFGPPYSRVDLGKSVENHPYVGAYIKQAPTAQSFPLASRTFDNGINDRMIKYLEDALNAYFAGSSPTQALSTMANGFTQVLTQYGLVSGTSAPASQ